MISEILSFVSNIVLDFINWSGYIGVFFLMLLESANIPIPSEIIMPFSGFLAAEGVFSFWLVVLIGALGNLVGSLISYWLASRILKLRERYLWLKIILPERFIIRSKEWFLKYGSWAAFFSRMLPVIRTFISLPAGIGKSNLLKFSVLTFIGSFIWSLLLTYLGWFLGENWTSLETYFRKFDLLILVVILFSAAYWAYGHFFKTSSGNQG